MENRNEREPSCRRLIRRPVVQDMCGLSSSAMYEQIANGTFPRPVPIGARAVAWVESEVEDWIDKRIEAARVGEVSTPHA